MTRVWTDEDRDERQTQVMVALEPADSKRLTVAMPPLFVELRAVRWDEGVTKVLPVEPELLEMAAERRSKRPLQRAATTRHDPDVSIDIDVTDLDAAPCFDQMPLDAPKRAATPHPFFQKNLASQLSRFVVTFGGVAISVTLALVTVGS